MLVWPVKDADESNPIEGYRILSCIMYGMRYHPHPWSHGDVRDLNH